MTIWMIMLSVNLCIYACVKKIIIIIIFILLDYIIIIKKKKIFKDN